MKGLTDNERELLQLLLRYPGHAEGGPSRPYEPWEQEAAEALIARGLLEFHNCPEPCPYSHGHVTAQGKLALLCYDTSRISS